MKPEERDNLLARLDERTNNIWKVLEQIQGTQNQLVEYQSEQNGFIRDNTIATAKNSAWRNTSKWLMGILFTLIVAMSGIIFGM